MFIRPIRKSLPTNEFNYPNKKKVSSHNVTAQTKIVRLVGNMQENINQLIQTISCQCGADIQFYQIAKVYCNKIQKLRNERNQYKQKYQQAMEKIKHYEENNQYLRQYWEFKGLESVDEQKTNVKNDLQQFSQQNLLLSDRSSYLQKQSPISKFQKKDKSLKIVTQKLNITQNPQKQDYYEAQFLKNKLGMNLQNINQYIEGRKQQRNTPKITKYKLPFHDQNYKITKRDENRQNGVIKGYKKQQIKNI